MRFDIHISGNKSGFEINPKGFEFIFSKPFFVNLGGVINSSSIRICVEDEPVAKQKSPRYFKPTGRRTSPIFEHPLKA